MFNDTQGNDAMPTFKHDCDCCEFVGQHAQDNGDLFDLYYCGKDIAGPTYVARFSNEGPDYMSTPASVLETHGKRYGADYPPFVAYKLHKARGNYSHSTGLKLGSLAPLI